MLRQSSIDLLETTVNELLDDAARLDAMKTALAALRVPDAADRIADLIADTAGVKVKVSA
jgi:UDP-N-acetylglucosamine:LPS N-acetylglucosamine transferase